MHVTLHITTACNMNCSYCYSPPVEGNTMSYETAKSCIDYISIHHPYNTGIIFFGGEPLLKKDLIIQTIDYAKSIKEKNGSYFHYKVTTNGLLLDEDFMKYAKNVKLDVSLSIDGLRQAHNQHRLLKNGGESFDLVEPKIELLLRNQPYAKFLMTVSPDTIQYYSKSFEYLIQKGCKYIISSLDYAAKWTDDDIKKLKIQYEQIAELYENFIMEERKFYFSPFDMKFTNHIRQDNNECFQCHLAKKQISIAFNGDIYPCVQFVKDGVSNTSFKIGDVLEGINVLKKEKMYEISKIENENCTKCSYNERCNNKCSCLNWQLTGEINQLSPKVCESERVLIPIVDKLGKKLFKKGAAMFIQKHYNMAYPILSMIEDNLSK
jgi:uncharacterized protein